MTAELTELAAAFFAGVALGAFGVCALALWLQHARGRDLGRKVWRNTRWYGGGS